MAFENGELGYRFHRDPSVPCSVQYGPRYPFVESPVCLAYPTDPGTGKPTEILSYDIMQDARTGMVQMQLDSSRFGLNVDNEYTATYRVIAIGPEVGAHQVLCPSQGAPCIGSPHPSDPTAALQRLDSSPVGTDGKAWDVRATWSNASTSGQNDTVIGIPLEVEFGAVIQREVAEFDLDGEPIVSSSDEAFDAATEIQKSYPTIRIVINRPTFDTSLLTSHVNAINDSTFWGLAPGRLKCNQINANKRYNPYGTPFYRMTFEFIVATEGFGWSNAAGEILIRDEGYFEKITSGAPAKTEYVRIKGKFGFPRTKPTALDGTGRVADDPATNGYTYLPFKIYKQANFFVLGLTNAI